MRMLRNGWIIAGLLLIGLGCGSGSSNPDPVEKPKNNKADAVGRLCKDAGLPADCDICQVRDWYDDGECDDFCKTPDPDCEPPDNTCSYDIPWDKAADTQELDDMVTGAWKVTMDNMEQLSELEAQQIWITVDHLFGPLGDEDFDIVFDLVDEGAFWVQTVETRDGSDYDWIKCYAGDTEVGAIFKYDTTTMVAEVGDGDFMGCQNEEPGCSWDKVWEVTSDSEHLETLVVSSKEVTIDEIDQLTETESKQIWDAIQAIDGSLGDADFDVVFEIPDEGLFEVKIVEADSGERFDWVRFYLGDTEVGVVFKHETVTMVAEIGDGDVFGCE